MEIVGQIVLCIMGLSFTALLIWAVITETRARIDALKRTKVVVTRSERDA